jgi:hypothetical protein
MYIYCYSKQADDLGRGLVFLSLSSRSLVSARKWRLVLFFCSSLSGCLLDVIFERGSVSCFIVRVLRVRWCRRYWYFSISDSRAPRYVRHERRHGVFLGLNYAPVRAGVHLRNQHIYTCRLTTFDCSIHPSLMHRGSPTGKRLPRHACANYIIPPRYSNWE